jgi:hypothetical protein
VRADRVKECENGVLDGVHGVCVGGRVRKRGDGLVTGAGVLTLLPVKGFRSSQQPAP